MSATCWIETTTAEQAKHLQERMWGLEVRETAAGPEVRVKGEGLFEDKEFWADAIARLKDNPQARLQMARRHLPLPAAFREAAVTLRAIVRERRRNEQEYEQELKELHRLAAIWSFYIPYAPRLGQPGYNVLARVPFSEFESITLTWEAIGYRELDLLTKTDRKCMVDAWGEPSNHTTAHQQRRDVWDRYEDVLIREQRAT
jgi:hypothetical protein